MKITVSKSLKITALMGFNEIKKESIWINFFVKSKSYSVLVPSGSYKLPQAKKQPELLDFIENAILNRINSNHVKTIPHPTDVRKVIKDVIKLNSFSKTECTRN